jgi:hypothetical protein
MTSATTSHHGCLRDCPPAAKWSGLAKYSFVGGNNAPNRFRLRV